ncbi:MAG: nucleotide exchange factor GrpE [Candidatus Nomurabacteria bacterium]|jgi:molecular chaperone GrpE|nr:nucleotide exchange factor GrpE [Candidatus Nomurabacteria bacterium]
MSKKQDKTAELTADLQRLRADFENYRKRVEGEKEAARAAGKVSVIFKLLPVLDDIELATAHVPNTLKDDDWAKGVQNLTKKLEKNLEAMDVRKIEAKPGTPFNPEQHEAITMDDGDGDHEVVAEELRAGYKLGTDVIRPAMVRVTKQNIDK